MENKVLGCKECHRNFDFSVRDQQFYAQKGFTNEPQRCKECRDARKAGGAASTLRPTFDAICAECSVQTTVPFKPRGDRPVLCRTCYSSRTPALV
ncbi:MAG: zinc-ribbon domain containing protein [Candidatus Baltobacteraceae bacterium]